MRKTLRYGLTRLTAPRAGRIIAVLALVLGFVTPAAAAEPGKLSGGQKYHLPDWFKESFLELADDATEAAEADKHAMLFLYMDECPYCDAVLKESLVESDYTGWLQKRFDVIGINVRGDREVAFNEEITVTEKELAELLGVRQTPAIIFLDAANKPVQRSDGYRTPTDVKRILNYVNDKAYLQTSLTSYIRSLDNPAPYQFRAHGAFTETDDLSKAKTPLVVLFEDASCTSCDLLHDTLLKHQDVNELMKQLTVVRLDAGSNAALTAPDGSKTTAADLAGILKMDARPGFVLMNEGKPLVRIEGVLRHFHFATALRYAAERKFEEYATYREYSRAYRQSLLDAGINVDLGKQ